MTAFIQPIPTSLDSDLPEGWTAAPITDICQIIRGVSYKKGEECYQPKRGFVPLIRANSIRGEIIFEDLLYVPVGHVSQDQMLRVGDAVIAMSSGSKSVVGKAATLRHQWNGTFGAFCGVLRPQTELDWRYFGMFFQTKEYRDKISEASAGVNINNLKREYFGHIDFPLPPIVEQRRIADEVNRLLEHVNIARDRLAHVPTILKRFRQAILAAASSGRLTADWREQHADSVPISRLLDDLRNISTTLKIRRGIPVDVERSDELRDLDLPATWSLQSMASLLRLGALLDLKDGNHGSNHPKSGEFGDTGMAFITAAQVKDYKIDYDGAPKVKGAYLKRLRVGFAKPGDAILTHKGTVGRAALNTSECVLTPQTTYYRCNAEILNSRYLVYFLTSPQFYSQLAAVMSQTTRDFVPISEQYRLFSILPPVDEQREIVRRVDALFDIADAIEKRVVGATARVKKLAQAILAKAFRGELVPTEAKLARSEGRAYESASVLLARIQANRPFKAERDQKRRQTNGKHKLRTLGKDHSAPKESGR